jgi:hypothetical protein
MKRWQHYHSLGVGALLGVAFASHQWTLLTLVFVAGLLLGRFWNLLHWSGEALKFRVMRAKRERINAKPQPVYYGRDEIPY